jgi:MFS family permease
VFCLLVGSILLMLRKRTDLQPLIAIPALVVLCAMTLGLLAHVVSNGTVTMTMGRWLPPFGISFTVDAMGAFFAATSSLVALAAGIYGRSDVDHSGRRYGFYPFLLLIMAGVLGAFMTGDIFNLYVWFEVLLISSFGLLVLGSERAQLDGGVKYAFLNLIATTLFLVATGYLYGLFGTLNMADIASRRSELRGTAPLMTLVTLFLLAFAMKAAAFPVNFWLPASYHTPRLVVSALFAGLLTKVGIYALLRILGMLFPVEREELSLIIAIVAALTMVLGVMGALAQNDIRRVDGLPGGLRHRGDDGRPCAWQPGRPVRRDLLCRPFHGGDDGAVFRHRHRGAAGRQLHALLRRWALCPQCRARISDPDAVPVGFRSAAVLRFLAQGGAGQGVAGRRRLVAGGIDPCDRAADDHCRRADLGAGLLAARKCGRAGTTRCRAIPAGRRGGRSCRSGGAVCRCGALARAGAGAGPGCGAGLIDPSAYVLSVFPGEVPQ